MDSEDRKTPTQVPSFRVKPLSQLLQTTVDDNESYSHNQVVEDKYQTDSIPANDLRNDEGPPTSVGFNAAGGERVAHEAVAPLMS